MESSNTMTARTLEEIEAPTGFAPRITLEELEGRTTYRTPGPWRVAPTSDYPPGEKPGINIDAGEFGLGGFVCEVCGPNPDEQMRADAYFIAHAPDLLAIAQDQRAEGAAKDKKILALRAESKMKDDTIQKIERQLQEANECRDPAYFAQIGRKRR